MRSGVPFGTPEYEEHQALTMQTKALLVICPRCHYTFDANQARLAALSSATRQVWDKAGMRFQHGFELVGPSELAARLGKSPSTISYHLDVLVGEGLAQRIPQNKYKRVRHLYVGTLRTTNGAN